MKQLAIRGLWLSGLAALARRLLTARGSFVLTFHGVASRRYEELPPSVQPSFDAAGLGAALGWLSRRFAFLEPEELLAGGRGVLLTFDDGFANNVENALPILEEYSAPAIFFVTAQHVQEPRDWLPATRETVGRHWESPEQVPEQIARDLFDGMSRDQLRTCAEHPLVTVGSHTVHHPFLTACDDRRLAEELAHSKALLEDWTGTGVELFAYPSGDYDLRVARATRAAGYRATFAEDTRSVGLPAWEIPRVGLYDSAAPYLAAKLSGLHRPAIPGTRLRSIFYPQPGR